MKLVSRNFRKLNENLNEICDGIGKQDSLLVDVKISVLNLQVIKWK